MRASISTWRTGMSICAIIWRTSSRRDGVSITNSLFERMSASALPRLDSTDCFSSVSISRSFSAVW